MKYIWEESDIITGAKLLNLSCMIHIICSLPPFDDKSYCLISYNDGIVQAGNMDRQAMAEFLNSKLYKPLLLCKENHPCTTS